MRLRLPKQLKEWVKASAERNHRSQNAEVLFWLSHAAQTEKASGSGLATSPDASHAE
ncbi:Arc family DNA-binding protein [Komagataeibacter sp. FNDCF1]|uniref:Arc family DNA-binding protein n=1 Tax=Komagataeibacter sp. FNDCF1 TaxID=2878681 RepID=UPI00351D9CA2|nr:Arc family DNA-binding protein [Komagataeibacter sp. FNDCF1]